ncbi:hypothetical protein B0F90DRAFT_1818367 [Multifurca ochricompacta]|uniref:Uncharacterized protein n=1 Tax=Multifurca ochricompacta TaxID=376703 RepID=A0AAD4M2T4_9AGAM|nr:hypothetical protein B0F90DRAFT_1818367 [Multifurca ochricompacta]
MELAMVNPPGELSAVDDFAMVLVLFRILRFTGGAVNRVARNRKDLIFLICGEEISDLEPQLIAERRVRALGTTPPTSNVPPRITMKGTIPLSTGFLSPPLLSKLFSLVSIPLKRR